MGEGGGRNPEKLGQDTWVTWVDLNIRNQAGCGRLCERQHGFYNEVNCVPQFMSL